MMNKSLLLASMMVVALAACGKKETPAPAPAAPAPAPATAPAPAPAPAPATAPAPAPAPAAAPSSSTPTDAAKQAADDAAKAVAGAKEMAGKADADKKQPGVKP
jgi:hypothetical protein